MHIALLIIPVIVVFLLLNLFLWWYASQSQYGKRIYPNDTYKVGDTTYTVPDLPLIGHARVLKEAYLLTQRQLLQDVLEMLKNKNIEHWLSGGTLLGFMRHGTFIPWDDDLDIHTHWKNREYLFSDEFANYLKSKRLETIFLTGLSNLEFATSVGAAVRIRYQNSHTPVCDIFFVQEHEQKICKVENWKNREDVVYNNKEKWDKNDIFPIQIKEIDGIKLPIPKNPENVLKEQYGETALAKMYARSTWFSHQYPFKVFSWVFSRK